MPLSPFIHLVTWREKKNEADVDICSLHAFKTYEKYNALALNIRRHSITLILCDVQSQQEHFPDALRS